MEAADEDIGVEPADDVLYALVGAAAEEDALAALLGEQVLLVAEVLGKERAVLLEL